MNRLEIGIEEVEDAFSQHYEKCIGMVFFGLSVQGEDRGGLDSQGVTDLNVMGNK